MDSSARRARFGALLAGAVMLSTPAAGIPEGRGPGARTFDSGGDPGPAMAGNPFGAEDAPRSRDARGGGSGPSPEHSGDGAAPSFLPAEWLPSRGRQCRRHRRRWVCDGPRKVPRPHGEAARLAEELGLGTRKTASILLLEAPRAEWVKAVAGSPPEKLLWPVDGGKLWRGYGRTRRRGRRRLHRGVDVGADEGTPIRAVADGLVAYSDTGVRGYGNLLMVVHADETVAYYAHCRANFVFAGEQVSAGQIIAEVGKTGISRGAHLHFELRQEGRAINPISRFADAPRRRRRSGASSRVKVRSRAKAQR